MTWEEILKLLVKKALFYSNNFIFSLIPPKKGLILFTSWFGQKYLDNCMYVYEYFLEKSEYHPVWMTYNQQIYKQLKKEGKPVALFHTKEGRWLQRRAEAVFSSVQFADYNTWLLSKCIYIDLGHGHPIKDPGRTAIEGSYSRENYKMISSKFFYFAIVSGLKSKREYNVVPVSPNHIFISDFARNDVFIDEKLREGKNQVIEEFKKGRRAVVYMPTHRSNGLIKMDMTELLPLDDIDKYCSDNNVVFIIKKHFYHRNENDNIDKYNNILDVSNIDDIDPQVLLCQADLLITDYSACYVDYMLLKRPVVFYQYDLVDYQERERTLYYDFETLQIAPVVKTKDNLLPTIGDLLNNKDPYLERRMNFAHENYFDNLEQKDGRAKVKAIFDNIYKQYIK